MDETIEQTTTDPNNPLLPQNPTPNNRPTRFIANTDFMAKQRKQNRAVGIIFGIVLVGGVSVLTIYSLRCRIPWTWINNNCPTEISNGELQYDPIISPYESDLSRAFNIKNNGTEAIEVQSISFISQLPLNNIVVSDDMKVEEVKLEEGYQYILSPKNGTSLISIEGGQTKSLMNYTIASVPQSNWLKEFTPLPSDVNSLQNNSTIEIPVVGQVMPHATPDYAILGTFTRDQLTTHDPMAQQLNTVDALVYRSLLITLEGHLYSSWGPEELRVMNLLELVKKQTGKQMWLSLSSTCSDGNNDFDFPRVLGNKDVMANATESISTFINGKELGGNIFDGVIIDYQYWSKACDTPFNEEDMVSFIKALRQKLNPNKTIYLSLPQGYRINNIIGALSELDGVVTGYHLHTDAPQHTVVTPKTQLKELPEIAKTYDPTYDVLKGNSTEATLNQLNVTVNKPPIVINFPSLAETYNGTDVKIRGGYGSPFEFSKEVDASTIYNNTDYTLVPEEDDIFSYGGNNGERGINVKNNIAASIPTEKQIQNAAEMVANNDNTFPKWLAVKDMYSGKGLITSASTFFHHSPQETHAVQPSSLSNAISTAAIGTLTAASSIFNIGWLTLLGGTAIGAAALYSCLSNNDKDKENNVVEENKINARV